MSMTELTRKLAFGASILAVSGAMAFAQEATTAPAADAPATTEAPAAPADGLSMGAEANTPPAPKTQETAAVGETYLASKSESWEQRCVKTEDGSDPCQLYQLLKDQQGTSVAEFTIFPLPAGGQAVAGATVIVPLETLLTANLALAIDGSKPKVYPYSFCAQIGCVARIGFTADEVAQLKKGAKAVMTLVPAVAPDQKVLLDISLKGFTAGFDGLKVPAAPKKN
ncbi:MAG: invasion associated locus B family protein [Paracoccaceae bacterium]